ncbi:glucan 1,3-beta-glucosidase [Pyronema domesticum]|uniref:glucan 1,3-beta-glucosidase n=1 Tax=Pyronema omphalodes (strain CBS 100304) TaxID=1076935 RepID=U4KV99_PYROM|nr:glucan 1,3-beta-glucosidase [Pyronema domesticum]CCX05413.1 Similar to Glucan 1,3-beta-glucosidase; acc. no. P15703 [Pyronema omphalodes CBS 100304]
MPSIISIVKASLLVLPALASASGTLGVALGIHKVNDQTCKTTEDFIADLKTIKKETGSTVVRIYTTSQCKAIASLAPALKATGSKAIVGLWPTGTDTIFMEETDAIVDALKSYADQILGVTVGSEHLYRKELTGEQLSKMIETVQKRTKEVAPNVPVGFADSWNKIQDGTADPAVAQSDLVLANAFSYWQGQEINNGTHSFVDDIMQALQHVQTIKKKTNVNFWVGETNWPTGGKDFEKAIPNVTNAARYWKEAICGILAWGVDTFVFEAFDEPWKPAEKNNDVERHWGIMDINGKPKFDLKCPNV